MSHRERSSNPPQDSSRPKEPLDGGTVQQPPVAQTEMVAFKVLGLPALSDLYSLTSNLLQIDGYCKVYWIKKNVISSEPGVLCEMFATLGLEGDGTSEEQAIKLNDVMPEDFETLVHFYHDFGSVIL